ncbi:GntR family transcriptional regulator [Streptomyces turgidiscabies]|uniref:GntR family transcriptional regulator n=1 Tax=Streptomyces turgidiscabies TaxID=85558 RepID=UPI0038F7BED1
MPEIHEMEAFSSRRLRACRTVVLDGVRWFNVMDLCETHGISDAAKAMKQLNNRDAREINCATEYGPWKMWFVTELGALRLLHKRAPRAPAPRKRAPRAPVPVEPLPERKPVERRTQGGRTLAKFMQIANDMRERINSDEWTPGQELPPVKETAKAWGVSTGTTHAAYVYLRNEGLIWWECTSATYGWFVAGVN